MVVNLLVTIAFMTLVERKLISAIQNRKGPNLVGVVGLLQPFADALKLILKESIFPRNSRTFVFILAPFLSLFFALLSWAFIPLSKGVILVDTNLAIFFIFACSILHVYGVILAGWASGSKYSFLGAVRSTAQLVAYDIAIGLTISCLVFYTQTMSVLGFVEFQRENGWFILYLPLLFIIFFISSLAETNRHPFDLPEAESELVGGYTTEYSSALFALFFLGEYCSILVMVFLINHLFLGGWYSWFGGTNLIGFLVYFIKILIIYYLFIIIRAAIPRYRYDQLMRLG
jgi:NADH-quinone oxidoreductase subunit H